MLDDPTWAKSHMKSTVCIHPATCGPLQALGSARIKFFSFVSSFSADKLSNDRSDTGAFGFTSSALERPSDAAAAKPLSIPRQLPPSRMRVLPVGVEHAIDVPVQRPQHPDPRVHQRPATVRHHDQRLDGGLSFPKVQLGLGSFMMKVAASFSVMSWRPRGGLIGPSNDRFQPRSVIGGRKRARPDIGLRLRFTIERNYVRPLIERHAKIRIQAPTNPAMR